jgi:DNA-binding MarR family transcriptional regulator
MIHSILDLIAGAPGHLGDLSDLPNKIEARLGLGVRAYCWPDERMIRKTVGEKPPHRRVPPSMERALAEFRRCGWLDEQRRGSAKARYRLKCAQLNRNNDVHRIRPEWIAKLVAGELQALDVILLAVLQSYGAACFPSQFTLARKTGSSVASIGRALRRVERQGLIRRLRHKGAKTRKGRTARYELIPAISGSEQPTNWDQNRGDGPNILETPPAFLMAASSADPAVLIDRKPTTIENQNLEFVVDRDVPGERGLYAEESQFEFERPGASIGNRAARTVEDEPERERTRNHQNLTRAKPHTTDPFELEHYAELIKRADPRDVDMTRAVLNRLVNTLRIPVLSPEPDAGIVWRNLVACVNILRDGKFTCRDQSIPKRAAVVREICDKLTRKKPRINDWPGILYAINEHCLGVRADKTKELWKAGFYGPEGKGTKDVLEFTCNEAESGPANDSREAEISRLVTFMMDRDHPEYCLDCTDAKLGPKEREDAMNRIREEAIREIDSARPEDRKAATERYMATEALCPQATT